jgi:NADH:ubiquinone oxidoreductase subunit K
MQSAAQMLVVLFSAFLAFWPAAFIVVGASHALAKRWSRLGQIALLLPVWSIAASIGLVQVPRLLNAFEPSGQRGLSLGSIMALLFALCCAAIAWALLVRAFRGRATAASSSSSAA